MKTSVDRLESTGIATARLDCLVLLEDATGRDRAWLLAHPEYELTKTQTSKLDQQIERRAKHEPLAYIRGKSEFYGREFIVNHHTLEPRPETETMIDLLKQIVEGGRWKVEGGVVFADVGTGSGCIAITAKLEFPKTTVLATDVSEECLKIARQNAKNLKADVKFYKGNLLQPLPSSIFHLPSSTFVILANLPYVPSHYQINQAAQHEPDIAIYGGPDGLDLYRQMFAQIAKLSTKPQWIFTESLPFQHAELAKIAEVTGYQLNQTEDFIQAFTAA